MSDGISQSPGEVYDSKVHDVLCTSCGHKRWSHVSGAQCIALNRTTNAECVCQRFTTKKQTRPSWDEYFLGIAQQVATRATCSRKHVGAVIVSLDRNILATGYNGSIPGTPHCDDAGHLLVFDPNTQRESCVRTIHAEANA